MSQIQVRLKFNLSKSTPGLQVLHAELLELPTGEERRSRIRQILLDYSASTKHARHPYKGDSFPTTEPRREMVPLTRSKDEEVSPSEAMKSGAQSAGISFS